MQLDIGTVHAAKAAIHQECGWLLQELAKLEQAGLDEGRGPEIRELVHAVQETVMFDVGSEIDNLASRLGQPGADLRAPAGMIIRWLHQDIHPLMKLAAPGFKDDAPLTPLLHLLIVAVGEIASQWIAVRDLLAPIEPDPFGSVAAETSR